MKNILYILIMMSLCSSMFAQSDQNESRISIRGTAIKNIGEIKDLWETGSAIYVSYENISSTQFSYMFQAGYMNFKENPNHEFEGSDPKFTIISLQIGGRYYILTDWIRPFMMAMTGVNILDSNYALKPDEEETGHEEYSGSVTKLNFQAGLGVDVKLFSNLHLEVLANYNSHILDAPTHYNITGLELGVGLNWIIQ